METTIAQKDIKKIVDGMKTIDFTTKESHIKIPIDDYRRLGFFQKNIINAINKISDPDELFNEDETALILSDLCLILKQTVMFEEYEMLDNLKIKNTKTV